ncbi:hypothetical protein DXG01_008070 [Tephrocybe rancida]|nr:hypothetical protein DXG01_008070 [Tephrocybe rancida]
MLAHILFATLVVFAVAKSSPPENFDPKCTDKMQPGFEMNIFQFNIPLQTFLNATGPSFFGSTGPLISTTGEDDTVGATRTGNFSGTVFRERLVDASQTPDRLLHRFTLDNGPITFANVLFTSYTEEMVAQSICEGTATWLSFTDKYCADNAAAGYNLYQRARRTLMDKLADNTGAMYFEGSCPIGKRVISESQHIRGSPFF